MSLHTATNASDALLACARRWADARVDRHGVATTPIDGVVILRQTAPSPVQYAISKPLVAIVLQGRKRVTMGSERYDFGTGESLLIACDVPTVSQVTLASSMAPYYSLVIELNPGVITELVGKMSPLSLTPQAPVRVDQTDDEVIAAASRLLNLLDRPLPLAALGHPVLRELHFWLLSGRHGQAIRALGVTDSHAHRIARAVELLRSRYTQPLRVETLADAAGMSLSTFYTHFRSTTTLTPLQFQKQLRLLEAQRRLFSEGAAISTAAYAVGYESVPQFTREYARLFGQPPARSLRQARDAEATG